MTTQNRGLFLISFVMLFLEILLIRWISTEVRIFAYVSNRVLLACFLGMGIGCYFSRRKENILVSFGLLAIIDVAIIGAGLAGAGAAITLARKGLRVTLIDPRETYQDCFKAEKIEPDQAELLRKFGLLEGLLPFASRIHKVISARNGSVLRVLCLEQYGIFYQDIVNSVRRQIPASVDWKTARVHNVSPGSDISRLTFMDGTSMSARLIILASGAGGNLSESLGIQRHMIRENQSFAIGCNMSREDGQPFSFEALTYYPDDAAERIAFLTLFPIQDVMRANLFVYRSPGEDWVSRSQADPSRGDCARLS